MGLLSIICYVIITLIFPPLTVLLIAGCGADLLINILLTILGYFPGHIHAFYILYIYYHRRDMIRRGVPLVRDAAGIFSQKVQSGGIRRY